MSYTRGRGEERFEVDGREVPIVWLLKDFPESDGTYYSVSQSMLPPTNATSVEDLIDWYEVKMIKMSILYHSGFEVDTIIEDDIYWKRDELPNGWDE